jgi:hypothetical protein
VADTKRVFLHIGAPKTGTTYLQAVLAHNREALRRLGLLYPPALADAHHTAAWDLRGTPAQRKQAQGIDGAWDSLVGRANAWSGATVVISSEMLVYCDDGQVATAVDAFEAEVHVVYTARDLVRQVPAVWQERIKNQQTIGFEEFVDSVLNPRAKPGPHGFWRAQDAPRALEPWSARLAPDRIHLVTTPPADQPRGVLLERFASVFGLTTSDLSTDLPTAANESLGLLQTELLRQYNVQHGHDMAWPLYRRTVRLQLASAFAAIRDDRRATLGARERATLTTRARELVDAIAGNGYSVVGDLEDLIPVQSRQPEEDVAPVTTEEVMVAAVDVLHATLSDNEARRRKNKRTAKGPPKDG